MAERVGRVLLAFDGAPHGERGVSELARMIGRERSQVSRMMKALARTGLVTQDEDRRTYRLGWRLRVLTAHAGDDELVDAVRPYLQFLVARTGEAALLSVQIGNEGLVVAREESRYSLQAGGRVGRRSPLHYTAVGRALMFDYDNAHVKTLVSDDLGISSCGPNAPRDLVTLFARLEREREQGYAVASEEVEIGLTAVAVPLRDASGRILGVLNVSGPSSRISDKTDSIGKIVMEASRQATRALGTRRGS
ncbi:MAG: IclR family transcriptional regulator [Actinomyces sp.]|nr:IclR family transcriptional regulator [Actinomyces sp.]MCI1641158.1 IclR family transcriptional regulator [Actinomyces sp.]MCI1786779.1 IclR family transcriptional regulator [Actinomyces sp.]MCI1829079.1 IclR family transcriptional regulator [Actinomyces sp.]MCI1866281.1 IclR family transcriptional regulator [Actinomyces sp.]